MPIEALNFEHYQKSISREFEAIQDRVRDLIGNAHWLTDGSHKEEFLRQVLRRHLPEIYNVGTGFVLASTGPTSQIDVMIVDRSSPTVYKDGDLLIVDPNAVRCIIEVKTKLTASETRTALRKVSDNVEKIRKGGNDRCIAGLFVYESTGITNDPFLQVLLGLNRAAKTKRSREVDLVSFGHTAFFRFWDKSLSWGAYKLEDLSRGFFLGNIVVELCYQDEIPLLEDYWFSTNKARHMRGSMPIKPLQKIQS